MTGTSWRPRANAAFRRKWPSTISPLLRVRMGILKPNCVKEAFNRSTAWSFLRGLRAYGTNLLRGQYSICTAVLQWGSSETEPDSKIRLPNSNAVLLAGIKLLGDSPG